MLADHHYFSKIKNVIVSLTGALFLSACSGVGSDIAGLGMSDSALPTSVTSSVRAPGIEVAQPVSGDAPIRSSAMTKLIQRVASRRTETKANLVKRQPVIEQVHYKKTVTESPWCNYLKENAAAETTILKAPTVSGQINDSGRKTASVSYDLVNVARAHLIEKGAQVKCERFKANSALKRVIVIAPNNLTRAGFAAKAKSISANRSRLRSVKSEIRRQLNIGNLDRNQSTVLILAADQILADGAKASSESAKRQGLVAFDIQNSADMARQLIKAERDLAEIKSDIRSADAVSVNLEGGWRDGLTQNGLTVQKDSLFGGVKVSVKLGAFNPSRKRHEEAALAARLRAHRYEPGSVFWKIAQLIAAHKRARSGLVASKRRLIMARENVQRLQSNLPANDPAYMAKRFGVVIEGVKLDAEIKAVSASIRQLDANLSKLSLLTTPRS